MPAADYPGGSEWRKWDLQVHTPFSSLNNGFGQDFKKYAKKLFERAVANQIAVIGVTDYFCIEGYKRLRSLVKDAKGLTGLLGPDLASQASRILLLPNIEFRTSVVVARAGGKDSRVNFHVIFSDDLEPEAIDDHFLRNLYFTAESHPDSQDERWRCTLENLKELGKKLKAEHGEFKKQSDLFLGMMNAVVDHGQITEVLKDQTSRFGARFLLAVPADEDLSDCSWDGQAHLTRKLFIQKSHMLFSANPGTRDFGLGKKHATQQAFRQEFGSLKPCIHGSDAHSYESLFAPDQNRHLWIKGDPTFQGLRQLLYEPEGRVFIGEEPASLARVQRNATKYINGLGFERTDLAGESEKWFSGSVPLNSGLIAIIGNKGSGKSALADVLAFLGDTKAAKHFSFLTADRFLAPKSKLGPMFRADVTWHSGHVVHRRLDEMIEPSAPELVKYIPQQYLEEICTELRESSDTEFDRELMEVIFSHVGDADRLGCATLGELITYLTDTKQQRIDQLISEMTDVNNAMASVEDELTDEYRKKVEAQLMQRRAELEAHDRARPVEMREPTQDAAAQETVQAVTGELSTLQRELAEVDNAIRSEQDKLATAARQIAAADRLVTRIENLERQVNTFYDDSVEDADVLGVDVRQLVVLTADSRPILELKAAAQTQSVAAKKALNAEERDSLAARRKSLNAAVDEKRRQLDEPNQRYQAYLIRLADWQERRSEIEGGDDVPNSLKGLETGLAALAALPSRLSSLREARLGLVRQIFEGEQQLLEDFGKLYAPVQQFIDAHSVSQQQGALQFSASIAVDGFVDGLLDMIHQGRKGSFQGEPEGRTRLRQLVAGGDFSSPGGVEAFLAVINEHLEHDQGDPNRSPVRVREQLRQGFTPQELYDFLYGLTYLRPRFELRWQGKPLDQLSPGERGTLLLVFYLLIDKRDVPLIVDQPEENLDNQTITATLVPAIKYAKERRQIVLVTHNPNLAVVCDADQVIHAHLDKTNGNLLTYTAGSIENPTITQLIVDVLEGTKPAFDLRDAKYEVLERLS